MRGKILVGLLALIPKPVVVANGYLIGNTPSRFWQFSGGNYFFLERLESSMHARRLDDLSKIKFYRETLNYQDYGRKNSSVNADRVA
jgi:hypothetical protein